MSNQKQVFKVGQKPTSWKKVVPDHKQRKSFPSPVEVDQKTTTVMQHGKPVLETSHTEPAADQTKPEVKQEFKARPITRRSKLTTKRIDSQDTTPVAGLGCMLTYYRGKAMINAYLWHKLYTYRPNKWDVAIALTIITTVASYLWAN